MIDDGRALTGTLGMGESMHRRVEGVMLTTIALVVVAAVAPHLRPADFDARTMMLIQALLLMMVLVGVTAVFRGAGCDAAQPSGRPRSGP